MADPIPEDDIKVPIQNSLGKGSPFVKLGQKSTVVLVLSYYGFIEDAQELMQKANHATRAFFISAKGLKGVL